MSQVKSGGYRRWWIIGAVAPHPGQQSESQSTSVPEAWADKQRAISLIGGISRNYGFGAPTIDSPETWPAQDRIRNLGGLTPDKQVIVYGMASG